MLVNTFAVSIINVDCTYVFFGANFRAYYMLLRVVFRVRPHDANISGHFICLQLVMSSIIPCDVQNVFAPVPLTAHPQRAVVSVLRSTTGGQI